MNETRDRCPYRDQNDAQCTRGRNHPGDHEPERLSLAELEARWRENVMLRRTP